jgi:hypothetical protein
MNIDAGPGGGPVGTIDSLAVVEIGGRLFIFRKGAKGDARIWMNKFDGSSMSG